ncbi:hypothetical protein HUU61_08715 [Rhodopseudomonas palustris]|nr:hypothetical protein [Rhodopseudomonas palustris]
MDIVRLTDFLVEAKRRTYAGLDDDATIATPALRGSKQLEHRASPFAYRDIYFGMGFFVGQETLSVDDQVVWSMAYSGGAQDDITDVATLRAIYAFLRRALAAVDPALPFRGPQFIRDGGLAYENSAVGTLSRFHGLETISCNDRKVYALHYSGGLLR